MTSTASTVPKPAPHRRAPNPRRGLIFFALPSLVWYVVFTIGPLTAMFAISLFSWRSLASKLNFVGLDNFSQLFQSTEFPAAVANTAVQLFASLPVMMVGGFMIGYFLYLKPPGHRVLRVMMFAPALISISALGTTFVAVLSPRGLVNGLLESVGRSDMVRPWLGDPQTALGSIVLITIWAGMGFNAVLFAARLAAVPSDIYQAADLDGASHWQKMWRIAFPIISDYFGVLSMLQYLGILFGSAALILILTSGGPGTSTTTLSWMVYNNAFITNQIGYSQAVGVILFGFGVVGLIAIRRIFRQRF